MSSSMIVPGIHFPDENGFQTVIERLKLATGANSDRALSLALGFKHAAVSAARRRQQIPAAWIVEAVIKFGASAPMIIFGNSRDNISDNSFALSVLPPTLNHNGELSATASEEYFLFRKDWLAHKGEIEQLRLLRASGNSMAPVIQNKDLILVDTGVKEIQSDSDYFAVSFNSHIFIKRILMEPGKIIMRAENVKLAPDIIISYDDVGLIKVLGKVVWWAHEVI